MPSLSSKGGKFKTSWRIFAKSISHNSNFIVKTPLFRVLQHSGLRKDLLQSIINQLPSLHQSSRQSLQTSGQLLINNINTANYRTFDPLLQNHTSIPPRCISNQWSPPRQAGKRVAIKQKIEPNPHANLRPHQKYGQEGVSRLPR
jgi:hypothetical protein